MKETNPAQGLVKANIRSVANMEETLVENRSFIDRVADLIGGFSGSMTFVGIHVVIFVTWFAVNSKLFPKLPHFDPYPYILLCMIVSVEGVLLSTFVLMKQNRMQKRIDVRDQLNLQIDLLAEKEVTKTLQMLRAICKRLEIDEAEFGAELIEMATTTSVDMVAQRVQSDLPKS